jgi:hypothetical protein
MTEIIDFKERKDKENGIIELLEQTLEKVKAGKFTSIYIVAIGSGKNESLFRFSINNDDLPEIIGLTTAVNNQLSMEIFEDE